jgi:hypothetical protein
MSHLYLLGVASLTLTSAGFAGSDMNADLQTRLEAAEARIAELSADQNQNWLNDERADAVRSLVQDVLADADTRASLQGGGANAGYDDGFTVASGDGNWSLKINGLVNTRWSMVDDEVAGTDTDGGFNTPTNWMNFSGTVGGDWGYDVRYNWDDTGSDISWANGSWDLGDGWGLTMGSFRLHTSRTAMIDDQDQLQLDGNDATVGNGISLGYGGDDLRFWADITNSNNGVGSANDGDYNTNFRFEYLAEGNWGQFGEFTSAEGGAAGTLVGLSYGSLSNNGGGLDTDGDTTWVIDVQMQFGGSNLYVAYTDFSDDSDSTGDFNQTDVMGGYYLNSDWELYVAYSDNDADDDATLSVGLNNYWAGQNAKWTTQYTVDETDDAGDITTISTNIQLYF